MESKTSNQLPRRELRRDRKLRGSTQGSTIGLGGSLANEDDLRAVRRFDFVAVENDRVLVLR